MFDRLDFIVDRYEEISAIISDPDVIADQDKYRKLLKELSNLEEIVESYREFKSLKEEISGAKEIAYDKTQDEDLREMAKAELLELEESLEGIEQKLKLLLLPKDPNDDKDIIVEIRAGAGGDEAALFTNSLFRMYSKYAERNGFSVEILSSNPTGIGGFKEIIFGITGTGAYSKFKFESGVHRVQRVPETESQGRIHTSTSTVAVLPEAEDVQIDINPNDLRIDVFRSSGNGGQSVNTTDSAVRITHAPSGIVVSCQDGKSQLKNKEKAMQVLKAKLYDLALASKNQEIADNRKSQVGSGDRSERIRTYNFPESRVTDHRIKLTLYKLESFLNGDLDELLDALVTEDQSEKLRAEGI